MSSDRQIELEKLFQEFDVNKDGNICFSDLIQWLKVHNTNNNVLHLLADNFLKSADIDKDGLVNFEEFVNYIETYDEKLNLAFREIEINMNNALDIEDVVSAFQRLNIYISVEQAEKLVGKIDSDGNWSLNGDHWRDFIIFHPLQTMDKIVNYWQNELCVEVGADWIIPEEFETTDGGVILQLKRLLSGGIAGAISRTSTAPLDRVKVLLQVHGYKHVNSGIVQSVHYMLKEGGFWSLWRGNGINVIKIVPETAIKFTMYEYFKLQLRKNTNSNNANQSLFHKFMAGSLAGVTSQAIIYPLETMKTRLCLRKTGQYDSILHCARMLYQEAGIRTFYRGFFINICGIIPYAGIELTLYEKCKALYMKWADLPVAGHPHPIIVPCMSSISATCGILTTYPFALIRTKLQSKTEFSERNINSVIGLFTTIYKTAGVKGLYRGVSANLCKVLPASSISYLTYEYLNRNFDLKSFGST